MGGGVQRHLTLVGPNRHEPAPLRHFPALDGIRALAVIAVLLYHFGAPYAAGGFLGVDLFFVLSGYLITGQLMTRWVNGPAITRNSFAVFWAARARRLFPPLAALLVCTSATVAVADRVQLSLFRGDVAAAATYVSNWWYVFHQRSYFVAAGRPPMLQHLWSLAVEEQFYLVWPVVILLVTLVVRVRWARRGVLLLVAVGLLTASAAVMGLGSMLSQVPEHGDPSRWYFGTDSHSFGLLAGAVLAIVRDGDGLGSRSSAPVPRLSRRATITGFVAFATVLAMLSQVGEFSTWLYRCGFLGFSVAATALVAVCTRRGALGRLFGIPLLVAIGRRSYSIYLWHWPTDRLHDASWRRPALAGLAGGLPASRTDACLHRGQLSADRDPDPAAGVAVHLAPVGCLAGGCRERTEADRGSARRRRCRSLSTRGSPGATAVVVCRRRHLCPLHDRCGRPPAAAGGRAHRR